MNHVISAEQFRSAFQLTGEGWAKYDPDCALVQLGLPTSGSLVIWFVARRGERSPLRVRVCARGCREADQPEPSQQREQLSEHGPLRVEIFGLAPDTPHDVSVSFEEAGAPQQRTLIAWTAPAATSTTTFSFLSSSCFQPYSRKAGAAVITHQTAHVLDLFLRRASGATATRPAFLLGLGDQIYVDNGSRAMLQGWRSQKARYAAGEVREFFETCYRSSFSLTPLQAALQALPSAMMWDDHEIRDGWGSHGDENSECAGAARWRSHLQAAREHFISWQAFRNPLPASANTSHMAWAARASLEADLTSSSELDFSFGWGESATFFVMDLRSHRCAAAQRVVSKDQLDRLRNWLLEPRTTPAVYVLCSPLPLTHVRMAIEIAEYAVPLRWDDLRDSWWAKACRKQRDEVLQLLHGFFRSHPEHRLLILSGDVHFSEVLEISDAEGNVFGHEIVSSGFAHASFHRFGRRSSQRREALARTVSARPPGDDVSARPPGDGVFAAGLGRFHGPAFAEIFVTPVDHSSPKLEVTFHVAVTRDGKSLANTELELPPRLELPLEPLTPQRLGPTGLFGRFIRATTSGPKPEDGAPGFR